MLKTRIRRVVQRYNDNKNSTKRLLKWTGIAVAIGILFVFMLPIILILAAVIGVLILVSLLYTKRKRGKTDTGIFDLISSIHTYLFRSNRANRRSKRWSNGSNTICVSMRKVSTFSCMMKKFLHKQVDNYRTNI